MTRHEKMPWFCPRCGAPHDAGDVEPGEVGDGHFTESIPPRHYYRCGHSVFPNGLVWQEVGPPYPLACDLQRECPAGNMCGVLGSSCTCGRTQRTTGRETCPGCDSHDAEEADVSEQQQDQPRSDTEEAAFMRGQSIALAQVIRKATANRLAQLGHEDRDWTWDRLNDAQHDALVHGAECAIVVARIAARKAATPLLNAAQDQQAEADRTLQAARYHQRRAARLHGLTWLILAAYTAGTWWLIIKHDLI